MRNPRNSLLALAAVASLAALSGCGGGGGGDTETTPPATVEETVAALSKEQLIEQGDAICAEVNAAVGSVGNTETDTTSQVTQVADLYTGMVERLTGLGEPSESAGYAEFIEAADELSQAQSDAQLASERGEEAGLTEAQSSAAEALAGFQEAAASYGFEDCSAAPAAPVAAGGVGGEEEVAPEEAAPEEVAPEEAAPEEVAPEEAAPEEAAPEGGGTGTGGGGSEAGGGSGGIGPG